MSKHYNIDFDKFVAAHKGDDGSLPDNESLQALVMDELNNWFDLRSKNDELIGSTLNTIYDNGSENLTLKRPLLITMALSTIGFTRENYDTLSSRIGQVIDSDKRFYSQKGQGGGVARMSEEQFAHYNDTLETPPMKKARELAEKRADKALARLPVPTVRQ